MHGDFDPERLQEIENDPYESDEDFPTSGEESDE